MININNIFKEFCIRKKFKEIKGSSILSDNEELLFNIAGITNSELKPYLKRKEITDDIFFSIQTCIRTEDIEEIGDETHLTSFNMLGIFAFNEKDPKRIIETVWEFITNILNKKDLFVVINENDSLSLNVWKNIIDEKQIELVSGEQNIWMASPEKGLFGFGSEIFFKEKDKEPLELANIVVVNKEKKKNKEIIDVPLTIDVGMGEARIKKTFEKAESIYSSTYNKFWFDQFEFTIKEKRILADHLHTIEIFLANDILPGNKKQSYICRKMIRKVIHIMKNHKLDLDQHIETIIKQEKLLIDKIKNNTIKYLNKNKLNINELTDEVKSYLSDTLGCTEYILESLLK